MIVRMLRTTRSGQEDMGTVSYVDGEFKVEGQLDPRSIARTLFGSEEVPDDADTILAAMRDMPRRYDGIYARAQIVGMGEGGKGSGWFAPPKGTHGPGSQGGKIGRKYPSTFDLTVQKGTPVSSGTTLSAGITDPLHVVFENGVDATFKEHGAQFTLHDGYSEVAGAELAQLLSPDERVAQETVNYRYEGLQGTMHEWIPGISGMEATYERKKNAVNDPKNQNRMETIVALDAIMDNGDRHEGNWIIDPDGYVWAIDHGHAGWESLYSGSRVPMARSPAWYMSNGPGYHTRNQHGSYVQTYRIRESTLERWRQIEIEDFIEVIQPQIDASADLQAWGRGYEPTRVNIENAWNNFQTLLDVGEIEYGF